MYDDEYRRGSEASYDGADFDGEESIGALRDMDSTYLGCGRLPGSAPARPTPSFCRRFNLARVPFCACTCLPPTSLHTLVAALNCSSCIF